MKSIKFEFELNEFVPPFCSKSHNLSHICIWSGKGGNYNPYLFHCLVICSCGRYVSMFASNKF